MAEKLGSENLVAISDLHGYDEPLEKAVGFYGDKPDRYLLNGDVIGAGPNTARILDIAKSIDADITLGNWELYLLAGLLHKDPETRQRIQTTARVFSERKGVLDAIVGSYGVETRNVKHSEKVKRLHEAMLEKSHLQMLAKAAMYFEGEDFIVVHAGLTDTDWSAQKLNLASARKDLVENTGEEEFDEPPQITSLSLAHQAESFTSTYKTVVTGHAHTPQGDRVTAGGTRVRTGSQLELHEPLFVWQSWNNEIKSFN